MIGGSGQVRPALEDGLADAASFCDSLSCAGLAVVRGTCQDSLSPCAYIMVQVQMDSVKSKVN